MNCLKTVTEAAKKQCQGLQIGQQIEVEKSNFLHNLHPNYLTGRRI